MYFLCQRGARCTEIARSSTLYSSIMLFKDTVRSSKTALISPKTVCASALPPLDCTRCKSDFHIFRNSSKEALSRRSSRRRESRAAIASPIALASRGEPSGETRCIPRCPAPPSCSTIGFASFSNSPSSELAPAGILKGSSTWSTPTVSIGTESTSSSLALRLGELFDSIAAESRVLREAAAGAANSLIANRSPADSDLGKSSLNSRRLSDQAVSASATDASRSLRRRSRSPKACSRVLSSATRRRSTSSPCCDITSVVERNCRISASLERICCCKRVISASLFASA
mmetsp:Transcript_10510/g.17167  ORF Transcript_10510/g.17167 Transcript_10510/m.17167 type:complete len:287 (+) Transcript_10510:617-1477(+)